MSGYGPPTRFHEEKAAFTVRGSDQPDLEAGVAAIRNVLETLPLTPNGKVDRRALPAPGGGAAMGRVYVAPRTPAETALAEVWAQVLRVEQVGALDNFFELGGDSILSIQLVSRARRAGLHLTPRQLFEHPTLAELARIRDALLEAGALVGASDHATTKALYAQDPDGIEFEVSWLLPADLITPEAQEQGASTRPLDLDREIERYGAQTRGGVGVSVPV